MRASFVNYLAAMRPAISEKTDPDTISPEDVGETGLADLVDILDTEIVVPNISGGGPTPVASFGSSGDFYLQSGNPVIVWQKISGTWTNKGTLEMGVTFPDGNFSVKTSLDAGVVTATPGYWFISNNQYIKTTQTQFNISSAHATLETQDLVYADTNDEILFTEGTPGMGQPTVPANCVLIDVAIIPSVASGDSPYLSLGFTATDETTIIKTTVNASQDDISGSDPYYLPVAYLTDDTIWKASWVWDGNTYYVSPDQLQGGNLYAGFPDPGTNTYTIKITYI